VRDWAIKTCGDQFGRSNAHIMKKSGVGATLTLGVRIGIEEGTGF